MAGKEYTVVRRFTRTNPKTGDDTVYQKGDVYDGPADESYLGSGPDGKGPLIAEKSSPQAAEKSTPPVDSSTKEKK